MLPARGRVARFVTPCVGSAMHGGVAIGPAERALRARSGLATIADDVTCAPLRWLERASDGFILRPERKSAVLPHSGAVVGAPPLPDPLSRRRRPGKSGSGRHRGPRR